MPNRTLRNLARHWIPLVYLIPAVYLLSPFFWTPLDYRFYNFFHSKRSGPQWTEVVVVGIDQATVEQQFRLPTYPLSRHENEHARVARELAGANARAIVFDLRLADDVFESKPAVLAETFRSIDRVYLVTTLIEKEQRTGSGSTEMRTLSAVMPESSLIAASRGAYVADVRVDPDGVLRRYESDPRMKTLGLEALPEFLSGSKLKHSMPIEFPSEQNPLPIISYGDVLSGSESIKPILMGRIVFVGSVLDESIDYISVPRMQTLNGGRKAFLLPGVAALAAITENLIKGAPLRDAGWLAVLLWNVFWSLLAVTVMPRRKPIGSAIFLAMVVIVSVGSTGILHAEAGLIFPAGLLVGCLLVCGGHAIVSSHITTAKELFAEEAEHERVRREFETARLTQLGFLPEELPTIGGFDLCGMNISSLEVSGDYYDVLDVAGGSAFVIAIADVSGKGLPAALLMSNVQAGLHSQAYQDTFDLAKVARNLNRLVFENTADEVFVTLFLAELSANTRVLRFVRAGHEMPFVLSEDGRIRNLEEGGLVLGFVPDVVYEPGEIELKEGDVVCFFTDGLTEAMNAKEEEFGIDRVSDVIRKNRGLSAREIADAAIEEVRRFTKLSTQADDITLLILRVERQPRHTRG